MKTKVNTIRFNMIKGLDFAENQIRELPKKARNHVWFEIENCLSREDQIKVIAVLIFILLMGFSTFFVLTFKLALFLFTFILLTDYVLCLNIKNHIKTEKRIDKIKGEINRLKDSQID